jgi:tight adherence protein C
LERFGFARSFISIFDGAYQPEAEAKGVQRAVEDYSGIMWCAFIAVTSFILLIYLLLIGRRTKLDTRLHDLSGQLGDVPAADPVAEFAMSALPKMGAPLVPDDQEERNRLQARLIHAGLYGRQAMYVFLGTKLLLVLAPPVLGLFAAVLGLWPFAYGLIVGALLGAFGLILPSFWLDWRKAKRQTNLRRSLPDALDVLVICLEGGVSLAAAMRRVARELRGAHPMLAEELLIAEREVQLGRTTGDALRQFGERCDLEEIRSLASVIIQAERFGASLAKALRVHADTLREKRLQYAEERAQKAVVKILFPTLFCIFPGIYLVVLGPAVIQIIDMFARLGR